MIGHEIPATLVVKGRQSISTERALKQILDLLSMVDPSDTPDPDYENNRLEASLSDIETMLKAIT